MINKTKITPFQLTFILIHAQVGVGVITLPYDLFLKAKGDAWISILITGAILQILLFLFWGLMNRFPSSNLFEIVQQLFGKIIGKIIIIIYCLYFIIIGTIVLSKYAYFLKAWMMPSTPKWLLVSIMAFTALFIVKDHIQIIARFTFLSSVVFIGFIGAAFFSFKFINITYILPVGVDGVMPIIKGLAPSLFSFQGFELLLIFFPFAQAEPKVVFKVASIANVFVTLFYTLLVFVCLTFFSPDELRLVPEPVLYLVKSFSFRIIERPDLLFTSMWIVLVATTFMCILFVSTLGITTVIHSTHLGRYALLIVGLCLIGGIGIQGIYEIEPISMYVNNVLVPIFYGLPILFLLVSIIFKKKEEVKKE